MAMWISRIASLVVALALGVIFIVAGVLEGGPLSDALWGALCFGLWALPCLALVWFPEEVGEATLFQFFGAGRYVDTESPPGCLVAFGWAALLAPLLLMWWFHGQRLQ